mgnify:CR=1 FL=1
MPKVEITYKAVGVNEDAEWGDYDHLMQRWEGLTKSVAILSRTLVLPWLLFPPITVKPVEDGSILTALIRLTFSISNLLIVTIKILTSNSECINFYRFSLRDNFTVF